MAARVPFDTKRAYQVLIGWTLKREELVITFHRKGKILAIAYLAMKNRSTPFRGRIKSGTIDVYIPPKDLLPVVKKARQIVFSSDENTISAREPLESLFPSDRPIWASPCRFCLLKGVVRFPRKPVKYGRDKICIDCAKAQLIKEAQSKGWSTSRAGIEYLGNLLRVAGDYDAALRTLSPEYDPSEDDSLSLYDVIEKSPTRYESISVEDLQDLAGGEREFQLFLEKLREWGIQDLLPVQVSAINSGLLGGKDLLVVSSTSSGKTLIAEMAGVPRALRGKKFYYLTPLVALANLRYSEFLDKYRGLGLKTAIRVGAGRIRTGRKRKLNTDIENADIVVGTYEGIEQVLRSGSAKRLGELGVVAIDEIQNLSEEERGARLDGLIKKLRVLCPSTQFLYLSATVGNPEQLAVGLGANLVFHDERPVPLERHLIPVASHGKKIHLMERLISREFSSTSKEGYRGQTLLFTNSRRRCHQLASALSTPGAPVSPYHSGLSYERRRQTEEEFVGQRIAAVATTAALAAGVDLPASQVIFETLAMGIEWISPAEFHQMLGRAGRLGFHGSGRAIMLIEPGRSCSRAERRTEDQVALELLSSGIDPVEPIYTHEDLVEQVLADASTFGMVKLGDLGRLQEYSIGFSSSIKPIIHELLGTGMIKKRGNSLVITPTGRIASSFFLSIDEGNSIVKSIKKGRDTITIVTSTSVFDRAYVSERLQKEVQQLTRRRTSVRFFDSDILELLSRPRRRPGRWFREVIWRITSDLLRCGCRNSPHCDCPPRKLSRVIIDRRTSGMDPDKISSYLFKRYGIEAYPGDIAEYLNNTVRLGEAIARFCDVLGKPGPGDRAREFYNRVVG